MGLLLAGMTGAAQGLNQVYTNHAADDLRAENKQDDLDKEKRIEEASIRLDQRSEASAIRSENRSRENKVSDSEEQRLLDNDPNRIKEDMARVSAQYDAEHPYGKEKTLAEINAINALAGARGRAGLLSGDSDEETWAHVNKLQDMVKFYTEQASGTDNAVQAAEYNTAADGFRKQIAMITNSGNAGSGSAIPGALIPGAPLPTEKPKDEIDNNGSSATVDARRAALLKEIGLIEQYKNFEASKRSWTNATPQKRSWTNAIPHGLTNEQLQIKIDQDKGILESMRSRAKHSE